MNAGVKEKGRLVTALSLSVVIYNIHSTIYKIQPKILYQSSFFFHTGQVKRKNCTALAVSLRASYCLYAGETALSSSAAAAAAANAVSNGVTFLAHFCV